MSHTFNGVNTVLMWISFPGTSRKTTGLFSFWQNGWNLSDGMWISSKWLNVPPFGSFTRFTRQCNAIFSCLNSNCTVYCCVTLSNSQHKLRVLCTLGQHCCRIVTCTHRPLGIQLIQQTGSRCSQTALPELALVLSRIISTCSSGSGTDPG